MAIMGSRSSQIKNRHKGAVVFGVYNNYLRQAVLVLFRSVTQNVHNPCSSIVRIGHIGWEKIYNCILTLQMGAFFYLKTFYKHPETNYVLPF